MELLDFQEMLKELHSFKYYRKLPVKRAVIMLPGVQVFAEKGNWNDDVNILLQHHTHSFG